MPRRKSAASLKRACLLNICENFNAVFFSSVKSWSSVHQHLEVTNYRMQTTGLSQLPGTLLEEVIETLKEVVSLLRRHHLHLVLLPSLVRCDISSLGVGEPYFALQFVRDRCHLLRHLDVSHQINVAPAALRATLECLPCLRSLNVRHTMCTDGTLAVVAVRCPDLSVLDVSECPVSDTGMNWLCLGHDNDARLCQKLTSLSVVDTEVTPLGAMVALRCLSSLKNFEVGCLLAAIHHALNRYENLQNLPLAVVRASLSDYNPARLQVAVKQCPFVRSVSLLQANFRNDTALTPLASLECLAELCVGNGVNGTLSFAGGVLPLLESKGKQLRKLHLTSFPSVDLVKVGKCCRDLSDLGLTRIKSFDGLDEEENEEQDSDDDYSYRRQTKVEDDSLFYNLQQLTVIGAEECDVPSSVFRRLLCRSLRLTNLHVKKCAYLDDSLLLEVLTGLNPLSFLNRLHIEECHWISADLLLELLLADNDLATLKVWSCGGIGQSAFSLLQVAAETRILDLHLDWFG